MSASASAALPAPGAGRTAGFVAFLLVGGMATVAATIYGNGDVAIAVAPVLLFTGLATIWLAPLRVSLFVLIALCLTIDSKGEGPWASPLATVGTLLQVNLNKSLPVNALALPGATLLLFYVTFIHIHRSITGSRVDRSARAQPARALLGALAVSFLAVIGICAWGIQNGGDVQMAKIQVQNYLLVLLVGYLCAVSLRGLRDYRIIARIVVAAACIKSVIAVWIVETVPPPFEVTNGRLAMATAHGDSLLFAAAAVMLIVRFAEQPVRRNGVACLTLLPILIAGMVANNRRLVWVEVSAALLTFWIVSRRSQVKRFVVHAVLAAIPLIVGYVAVGWNSQSRLFAPVHLFRSVGDSDVDASTLYRDLENYNLIATMKTSPFMGTGFGHPFVELVKLPDISFFKEYQYLPHNSLLGLWAFCGPFGFTGLSLVLVVAIYLASRSYQHAREPDERVAAFMALAMVVIFMAHCWGDIGFSERRNIFLVGPALAIAGQLAVSTGAWRARTARRQL